jgi:DNA polymerase I-like protein with 3'-5' exonuclease and polymerase domains
MDLRENMYVMDMEGDKHPSTKIHCLSFCNVKDGVIRSFTTYSEMRKWLLQEGVTLIGHMLTLYDIPTLERILGIKIKAKLIDTLPISWTLEPSRIIHGLESYGEEFGVPKPPITDWENLSVEEYVHRCEEDVKINLRLWQKQFRYLRNLYDEDLRAINRYVSYLSFKMDCVREQEEIGLKLDVERCKKTLSKLEELKLAKQRELERVMPKVPIYKKKKYENAVVDKDGNLHMEGELFYTPSKTIAKEEEIKKITGYKAPNSNSHDQIKDWLYSLGWIPEHIKHDRNKETGETKEIPQIASKKKDGQICDSIKKLYDKEPKLELLNGLSVLSHRISIFKGYLENVIDGRLYAGAAGLTNTLRLKHKVIVNLPSVDKAYGDEVRGCIIADEGHVLCGSDLSNIEDRTKRHYIYQYDPKYVEDMNTPGYDAHLEIAVLAGFMQKEDMDFYKWYDKQSEDLSWHGTEEEVKRYKVLKPIRTKSKVTNFSATYKVGAPSLSRNAGISLSEAKKLLKIYWDRNAAILKVEDSLNIKQIGTQRWLQNPINGYWYSLRADKDKFSTLNQGTAVYCFDIWITYLRQLGIKIGLQYHDEVLFNVKLGEENTINNKIKQAMDMTNERLKLNIQVGCGTQWGQNYADCH